MKWTYPILWLIFAAFAVMRFGIESQHPVIDFASLYKTAAHFFVGGLLGASLVKFFGRDSGETVSVSGWLQRPTFRSDSDWWIPALISGLLTLVEVVAFFYGKAN